MDFAIIHSLYRYPVIPPVDLWYGGEPLNVYYYFGFWIFASLGSIIKIPPQILYNLALPTIVALTAVNLYGIGKIFLKKYSIIILGLIFIPDPALFWMLPKTSILDAYNQSSYVISGTLNEYMAASLLVSDIHPHIISFMVQTYLIFLLSIIFACWKIFSLNQKILMSFFLSLSLGVLVPLNTWAIFLYAPLFVLVVLWIVFIDLWDGSFNSIRQKVVMISHEIQDIIYHHNKSIDSGKKQIFYQVLIFASIPLTAILLYLPYYFQSNAQSLPIKFVHSPSSVIPFLLVWGFFMAILFFWYRKTIRDNPWILLILIPALLSGYGAAGIAIVLLGYSIIQKKNFVDLLVMIGLSGIIFCEFFYLFDNLQENIYRLNTVFKFYSISWIILGSACFLIIGSYLETNNSFLKYQKYIYPLTFLVIFLSVICIIPLNLACFGISENYGLRGDAFLQKDIPSDYHGISFLRNMTGSHVIVESTDFSNDFTILGRISVFSGIPTILGWFEHEILWRSHISGSKGIMDRVLAVREIYENPDLSLYLMDEYGADLLYVGDVERKKYNVSLPLNGLNLIYNYDDVQIYQRNSFPSWIPNETSLKVTMWYPDYNQQNLEKNTKHYFFDFFQE